MSNFSILIKCINSIEPHSNADSIEFACIDGYRSLVKKGQFSVGDLIAYIPEASVLPQWILKKLEMWDSVKEKGKLSGTLGNRVKAIKLRGEISQGICFPLIKTCLETDILWNIEKIENWYTYCKGVYEGDDVTEFLEITKYEPPIPVALAGEVFNAGQNLTVNFDIENWKSYPNVLKDEEEVIFTEKLHGTFTGVAILPFRDSHPEAFGINKNILIFSKGLGAKGLVFKNNENNKENLYIRSTRKLIENIEKHWCKFEGLDYYHPVFILGESFGPGVQDLTYGKEIDFRIFAIARGYRGNQSYLNFDIVELIAEKLNIKTVPILYIGPFYKELMLNCTKGKTTLDANHIREGIVIVPTTERLDKQIGRVCLKSVSEDYLTRKGGSEYN